MHINERRTNCLDKIVECIASAINIPTRLQIEFHLALKFFGLFLKPYVQKVCVIVDWLENSICFGA